MITTVTLNAAIDKTYIVPGFQKSRLFRVEQTVSEAGGKGINVARVITLLGGSAIAIGFIAGMQGRVIADSLTAQGVPHEFTLAEGESRVCLTVLDPESEADQTELLEPGPLVDNGHLDALRAKVDTLAARSSLVVLSGSMPRGCPVDIYAELAAIAMNRGAKVVLDTSGEALAAGVEARPFLIKPNEHEIGTLLGATPRKDAELIDAVRELMGRGIACVVVSLGARGAIAGWFGELYRVTAPKIDAVNPVGCGDSMVAGLVTAIERGCAARSSLRLGAACGAANALQLRAGVVAPGDVHRLLQEVRIEALGGVDTIA